MVRTTIKISEVLDARLRHEAGLRGTTLSEVIREALEARYGSRKRRTFLADGAGASGCGDIAARIEEILDSEGWQ
jgi:hypothetical protein